MYKIIIIIIYDLNKKDIKNKKLLKKLFLITRVFIKKLFEKNYKRFIYFNRSRTRGLYREIIKNN